MMCTKNSNGKTEILPLFKQAQHKDEKFYHVSQQHMEQKDCPVSMMGRSTPGFQPMGEGNTIVMVLPVLASLDGCHQRLVVVI